MSSPSSIDKPALYLALAGFFCVNGAILLHMLGRGSRVSVAAIVFIGAALATAAWIRLRKSSTPEVPPSE